ncbi:MAG: hypothetical protein OHK0039_20500 [Bacteroidia bacterium]
MLEDDSYVVQMEIRRALLAFGQSLEEETRSLWYGLDAENKLILDQILEQIDRESLDVRWMGWLEQGNSATGLEAALASISLLETGEQPGEAGVLLDRLAKRFLKNYPTPGIPQLMEFLFRKVKFHATNDGQLQPTHHSLSYVLAHRCGSQIMLSCVAILLARRVGLQLDGIMIQGNFLPMSYHDRKLEMYNALNGGQPLARASVMYVEEALRRNHIMPTDMRATVSEIVLQIIRDLIDAHLKCQHQRKARTYVVRYRLLIEELGRRGIAIT